MKKTILVVLLAAIALPAFAKKATVKVINQSKWEIHHLFISPASEEDWGPDQLEDEVLGKGDSITITNIPCDEYDVKVVDEDGDECIIEAADLCRDNSYWKITDKDLLECEGYQ
ncbi:MAG TPA: hypothetical protein VNI54_01050 [Thermoanaerobaculia bacterium]|nr:hypothetical protein [Thermoanaerobaculia bacterium]